MKGIRTAECIATGNNGYITVGKSYRVIQMCDDKIRICNDTGSTDYWYPAYLFNITKKPTNNDV